MRVCDWIAEELYRRGVRNIYGLMGGGAAGLNDGFIKQGQLNYVCFHHEQGAGHAAVGEAKLTGKLSVVNPTTGCGGTNCITSVLNAWQDSVPVLFISGNVKAGHCSRVINNRRNINIRKYGIQEHDIIETVKSITKYSVFVEFDYQITDEIDRAINIATSGRPGPVWLDIPSDVQTSEISDQYVEWYNNRLTTFSSSNTFDQYQYEETIYKILTEVSHARRPIVMAGQGIRQSNTIELFKEFIETYNIPYVSTYGARDLLAYDHPLNIGAIGIKGSRAGNFAMQAADVILSLGCSVNSSHIGYDTDSWTPNAKRFVVDIDNNELDKNLVKWNEKLNCDLATFFQSIKGIKL